MLKLLKETPRKSQEITDREKIRYILQEYTAQSGCFLKDAEIPVRVDVQPGEDGEYLFVMPSGPAAELSSQFTLYSNCKKQIELQCSIREKEDENRIIGEISRLSIALDVRKHDRFAISDDAVMADNFIISKNRIDLTPMTPAVSNSVIFHGFERQLKDRFPDLKIVDLDPSDRSLETVLVRKHRQGALVPDFFSDSSAVPEGMADLGALFRQEYPAFCQTMKDRNIRSLLVRPIMYTNLKGEEFPLAYFLRRNSDTGFTAADYEALAETEEQIIAKIKDSNTIKLKQRNLIRNISLGGLLLQVEDAEFADYLMNRDDMTFDVIFRMQQPLRFHGRIRHIRRNDQDESLQVGMEFTGTVKDRGKAEDSRRMLSENIRYLIRTGKTGVVA